jgi:nucleoside-diphosphate-sugar epimerase
LAEKAVSRIVVIGGSGHIGTYLMPALAAQGHEVVNISRGLAKPYRPHPAWESIRQIAVDRTVEEQSGTFGARVAGLRPDVVVDLISFDLPSTRSLVESLRGKVEHFLHCGTIWVYGHNAAVPADETDPPNPICRYGIHKAAIESWLLDEAHRTGFPATVFRPGHIVGPGWVPIGPHGTIDKELFSAMARGDRITLPNFGLETLHHVHADDVAQFVLRALADRPASVGETFNVVSERALNLRGYAEAMFRWFGTEPRIGYQPFDRWKASLPPQQAQDAWEHLVRGSCMSIEKARRRLGYQPRYTSLAAIQESVSALIDAGEVERPQAWKQAAPAGSS